MSLCCKQGYIVFSLKAPTESEASCSIATRIIWTAHVCLFGAELPIGAFVKILYHIFISFWAEAFIVVGMVGVIDALALAVAWIRICSATPFTHFAVLSTPVILALAHIPGPLSKDPYFFTHAHNSIQCFLSMAKFSRGEGQLNHQGCQHHILCPTPFTVQ